MMLQPENARTSPLYDQLGLMIVGAQKAGTTGLFRLLGTHNDVAVSPYTETRWLTLDSEADRDDDWVLWKYFGQAAAANTLIGKDINLFRHTSGLKRLAECSGRVTIVSMLRNPVSRARSAYWYNRMLGQEQAPTFEQALHRARTQGRDGVECMCGSRRHGYLFNGHYRAHIELVDSLFGADRHVVLIAEDTFEDERGVAGRLLERAGLNTDLWLPTEADSASSNNIGGEARAVWLRHVIRMPYKLPKWMKNPIRAIVNPYRLAGAMKWVDRMNRRDFTPPPLSQETKRELSAYFVQANGDLTDRVDSEQPWVKGIFT